MVCQGCQELVQLFLELLCGLVVGVPQMSMKAVKQGWPTFWQL